MVSTRRMLFQCRFCLEDDSLRNLITPCVCNGSGKYIHAKCAFKWYEHNPSKGLYCPVCMSRLATKNTHMLEKHPLEGTLYWKWIEHPALLINIYHLIFYFWCVILDINSKKGIPFSFPSYILLQTMYHGYMIYLYILCIRSLQNRRRYWPHWYRTSRMAIPLAHCFFIAALSSQRFLAGLSADICLMYYIMEHLEILDELNRSVKIEFVSTELQEEPSSSELASSSALAQQFQD